MLSAVRFRSPLSIFFAVFVAETVGSYPRGPGCGALLTDNLVNYTTKVESSYNDSFDESHIFLNSTGAWCALWNHGLVYPEFTFDKQVNISVFAYQGRSNSQDYVTKLFIFFRRINLWNIFWYHYPTDDNVEYFDYAPTTDGDEIAYFPLDGLVAQQVRIRVQTWNKICMRVELYGCVVVNGGFSNWSDWTRCSNPCGNGTSFRNRTCTNPAPLHGGKYCEGDFNETMDCVGNECPVNGGFSNWSDWTRCSNPCGNGTSFRYRTCTNPAPLHGGKYCEGNLYEMMDCEGNECPVNGGFSDWSEWNTCSVTCGTGFQLRQRNCTNPPPAHGGQKCDSEDFTEVRNCTASACYAKVDGGFSEWSNWTTCSASCGSGFQLRYRNCTSPLPAHGGKSCESRNFTDVRTCLMGACNLPVDGGFSEWSNWTACGVVCGTGFQLRHRNCTSPSPAYGGKSCESKNFTEGRTCAMGPCQLPVDGGFSEWSDWTTCSVSCGSGFQLRYRNCTSPPPAHGGKSCESRNFTDVRTCLMGACNLPVDGGFSEWSNWTTCSVVCGTGFQLRHRNCTSPSPAYGGKSCESKNFTEGRTCAMGPCQLPVDGGFSEWSNWTNCSVPCGTGFQLRHRNCSSPPPAHEGQGCESKNFTEGRICVMGPCHVPVNGGFSEWSNWTTCSVSCGTGYQLRHRNCTSPPPAYGGQDCESGKFTEGQTCVMEACRLPVDGGFSEWSDWTTCSVSCGNGFQLRHRNCTSPPPAHGGKSCEGKNFTDVRNCSTTECFSKVDGGFSKWSAWTTCSASCGTGLQLRYRNCTNPPPAHGGKNCESRNIYEGRSCNMKACQSDVGFVNANTGAGGPGDEEEHGSNEYFVAMIVFAVALALSILIGITACYVLRDQSSRSRNIARVENTRLDGKFVYVMDAMKT
ncbi:coadhesin isoform X2 [Pocillopora verrucosa]|uniref:coadhesin isoform X2 n=1 Tax=Pocillopora verrucosa TaxID=203993 RepID=UPI003341508E